MLEVEMKFADVDFADLEGRLTTLGGVPGESIEEEDQYFNAPDRDFARTDEALRIRRIGPANLVTYKGPKLDRQTKTRTEIEVPLASGDEQAAAFAELLKHLGYRPVAVVRKRRRLYHLKKESFALEICLDDVDNVGRFAEIEIQAPEASLDAARAVLLETAKQLGLAHAERRSYLEMLLNATKH